MLVPSKEHNSSYTFADFIAITPRPFDTSLPNRNLVSRQELAFWKNNPPEEIIIASASMRRGILLSHLLLGIQFPGFQNDVAQLPLDLQYYFETYIPNGDGKLPAGEKVLLGYYQGVPVFQERQDGETPHNDHMVQARNKADFMKARYSGRDVIIVAIDTVDRPNTVHESLGKPCNTDEYSNYSMAEHDGLTFNEWYLQKYFPVGTIDTHFNGVVVSRTRQERQVSTERSIQLSVEVLEKLYSALSVFHECAGGGIPQQLIEWCSPEEVSATMPEEMQTAVANCSEEIAMWTLYSHITGMPWWAIKDMIQEIINQVEVKPEEDKIYDTMTV